MKASRIVIKCCLLSLMNFSFWKLRLSCLATVPTFWCNINSLCVSAAAAWHVESWCFLHFSPSFLQSRSPVTEKVGSVVGPPKSQHSWQNVASCATLYSNHEKWEYQWVLKCLACKFCGNVMNGWLGFSPFFDKSLRDKASVPTSLVLNTVATILGLLESEIETDESSTSKLPTPGVGDSWLWMLETGCVSGSVRFRFTKYDDIFVCGNL